MNAEIQEGHTADCKDDLRTMRLHLDRAIGVARSKLKGTMHDYTAVCGGCKHVWRLGCICMVPFSYSAILYLTKTKIPWRQVYMP